MEAIARSLALRGVLESTGEGTWTLSGDAGAIVAPLIGSRHVAWLTWTDAAGAHGAAALGRVETAWSLLREDRGALRVTALDAVSPGETAAALGGVTSAGRPGDGPVVHAAATELRPGCAVAGLGTIAAAAAVRFVRPAGSGLEQSEITWLHDAEGGLWEVTADGTAALCASPVTSASLIARVTEGFESEDTQP